MSISVNNPAKRHRGAEAIADWFARATAPTYLPEPSRRRVPVRSASVNGSGAQRSFFVMPAKRFKRRRFGASVKRRRYGRANRSALNLKMGGLRLRRFRRVGRKRFRRGLKKALYPAWFKALIKGISCSDFAGTYGAVMLGNINSTNACTHWKALSPLDLQIGLDSIKNAAGSTAHTANVYQNTCKAYISDVTRRHTWRNNLTSGESQIQFYTLVPRRDIPHTFGTLGGTAPSPSTIAPPVSTDYKTGGMLNGPTMYSQSVADESAGAGSAVQILTGGPTDWSPYWSQTLTSMFKIKPLKVIGPNGKSSVHRLQPGQECYYEGKSSKPRMVSFNKFGLDNYTNNSQSIANTWNVLRETPLIFCVHKGGVVHDSTTNTSIGTGAMQIDYFQTYKLKVWQIAGNFKEQSFITTGVPALAVARMAQIVTGTNATEAQDA